MTEFEAKAVVDAINRMFKGLHYNICVVDHCMAVAGAVRTKDYAAMHLYHCVNFGTMDRETKDFLFRATIENVTNVDDFPAVRLINRSEEIEQQLILDHKSKPLMKRLFGIS